MDVAPLSASTLAPPPPQQKPTPEVMKAAREFENMMLGQMLQPMFAGLKTDGEFGGGSGEEMFRPMLIEQYAKAMGNAGGVGLADSIAREIMRLQTTTEPTNGAAG
jgi:Rod binding domain-containing protein